VEIKNETEIVDSFKREATYDYIGLWEIIHAIKEETSNTENLMLNSLRIVQLMLDAGFRAGFPDKSGANFEELPDQSPDLILSKVESEWIKLGREPNVGEIVWFDLKVSN
jgi:hypothetical protein